MRARGRGKNSQLLFLNKTKSHQSSRLADAQQLIERESRGKTRFTSGLRLEVQEKIIFAGNLNTQHPRSGVNSKKNPATKVAGKKSLAKFLFSRLGEEISFNRACSLKLVFARKLSDVIEDRENLRRQTKLTAGNSPKLESDAESAKEGMQQQPRRWGGKKLELGWEGRIYTPGSR